MESFPEDAELRDLFGVEPAVLDPNLPWLRNVLNFDAVIGADRLECVIEPAYQTLSLRWTRRGRELVFFDLERVAALQVDRYRGRGSLIVRFDPALDRGLVRIQIRPAVHVTWVAGGRTAGAPEVAENQLGL